MLNSSSPHLPATPLAIAIIVAAGRGLRAGGGLPKQYRELGGIPVLARTLALFDRHPGIARLVVVVGEDDDLWISNCVSGVKKPVQIVRGGTTRQISCLNGLSAIEAQKPDIVLLHDAARPFASEALVTRAIDAACDYGACVPGIRITDTVKEIAADNHVKRTPDRESLRAIQTPQAFSFPLILQAHRRAALAGIDSLTDDGAVVEWAGHSLFVFEGEITNMKITTEKDFDNAKQYIKDISSLGDVRTGTGFDVHAFTEGDHIWLNGLRIPHSHTLKGHSDADVGLHALTDAVLGAISDGDIGAHFPPSDPQWKGASSDQFLSYAVARVAQRGGAIAHLDVTVLCEEPKIGPHREAMRTRIAAITGVPVERISVKATTTERLGFTGRKEGIAAMASATVRLPW